VDHLESAALQFDSHHLEGSSVFVVSEEEESLIGLSCWRRDAEHQTAVLDHESAPRRATRCLVADLAHLIMVGTEGYQDSVGQNMTTGRSVAS
jgi:hypothetical protein